jgi:lactoylglutathione lyase
VLGTLGIGIGGEGPGFVWADELVLSSTDSPASQGKLTGPTHLAFQAPDRETVNRFHAAALAAGGKDNGGPGERPYHPGYYAAFVRDPDGNNVEVVYHGPATRSAPSVVITF